MEQYTWDVFNLTWKLSSWMFSFLIGCFYSVFTFWDWFILMDLATRNFFSCYVKFHCKNTSTMMCRWTKVLFGCFTFGISKNISSVKILISCTDMWLSEYFIKRLEETKGLSNGNSFQKVCVCFHFHNYFENFSSHLPQFWLWSDFSWIIFWNKLYFTVTLFFFSLMSNKIKHILICLWIIHVSLQ